MIDTFRMKINTFPLLKIKNYSEFVVKEKPSKKAVVIKKAAIAASADQRRMVRKAKRLTK